MNDLETQVAKIQFGNPKATTTYVLVVAEQAFNGQAELYLIVELPMLNPAALGECETIAEAMAASLRRSYRKPVNSTSFENALAGLNEELGKLVSMGKSNWIGKLNALVAVKNESLLNIATTGKMSGVLLRDQEFTSIVDVNSKTNPLKVFENFATGKMKLNDILILSTSQLFNHVSSDRIKNILLSHTLPLAGQEILRILQENAGPEIAFGSLFGLMVSPGSTTTQNITLEEYVAPPKPHKKLAQQVSSSALLMGKKSLDLVKLTGQKTKALLSARGSKDFKTIIIKNKEFLSAAGSVAKRNFTLESFQKFSKQKKFFFISAILLVGALIANIVLTSQYNSNKTTPTVFSNTLLEIQTLLDNSSAALLYEDEVQAAELFSQAKSKLDSLTKLSDSQKKELEPVQKTIDEIQQKIEKKVSVEASTIATLSQSDHLITTPSYIATQTNGSFVSYERSSGKVQDNILIASEKINESIFYKEDLVIIYSGEKLFLWNTKTSTLGSGFADNVPNDNKAKGLALYNTNNRIYTIDSSGGRIISFAVTDKDISKFSVAVSSSDLSRGQDLAIDGNIYVLTDQTVLKFQSGKPLTFNFPKLSTPLAENGRIKVDSKSVYVLDSVNKRLIVLDKNGNLKKIITSPQLTNPKDFIIEESTNSALVLNNGTLLKLGL